MRVELKHFRDHTDGVAMRSPLENAEVESYLNGKLHDILTNRGVEHPFLNTYTVQGLHGQAERLLYLETYYYFKDVPFYICSMCTLTRDENVLREVVRNVADELGDKVSHAQLFQDFLTRIGIHQQDILAYGCLEATRALNIGTLELYTKSSIAKALGSFYAEESQSAAMVAKYHAGLVKSGYGAETTAFWKMHMEAELGHGNGAFRCAEPYLQTKAGRLEFEAGISAYMGLLEAFWDGLESLISPLLKDG